MIGYIICTLCGFILGCVAMLIYIGYKLPDLPKETIVFFDDGLSGTSTNFGQTGHVNEPIDPTSNSI